MPKLGGGNITFYLRASLPSPNLSCCYVTATEAKEIKSMGYLLRTSENHTVCYGEPKKHFLITGNGSCFCAE